MPIQNKQHKTLEWLKTQELPTGGIAAWPGMVAYPEVTGYLIPTFINYGEIELAQRCADWLLSIQNPDGSFNGLDDRPRAFDTAAIVEGLRETWNISITNYPHVQIQLAADWLKTQLREVDPPDMMLIDTPANQVINEYNIRALAIMGRSISNYEWLAQANSQVRTHYYLYALEGLLNMGYEDFVREQLETLKIDPRDGLLPFYFLGHGSDSCATAQAACLRLRLGMPADAEMEALAKKMNSDGSFSHDNNDQRKTAWVCKFYLDALWYQENL